MLYAVWGNAPSEIVQLLVQSYKSIFPNYELNWTMMMETLGRAKIARDNVARLCNIQRKEFPDQHIDMDTILEKAITLTNPDCLNNTSTYSFRSLLICSIIRRYLAIRNKALRKELGKMY